MHDARFVIHDYLYRVPSIIHHVYLVPWILHPECLHLFQNGILAVPV